MFKKSIRKYGIPTLKMFGMVVFGLAIVLGSFSAAFGFSVTISAFSKGILNLNRAGEVLSLRSGGLETSNLSGAILGSSEAKYEDLDLKDFQVKPFRVEVKEATPLLIPTNGIAAHKDFLYNEESHPGVDIWTNTKGTGLNGTSRGYPVYSACSGKVIRIFLPNQEIEIQCDSLPIEYRDMVPSLNIKILYSHLGDGATKEVYHDLKLGQRLERGELVGYQGDISSFVPENRVVHLHFGVYDLNIRRPLNPAPYLGYDEIRLGHTFEVGF
ncbi:hypothetical protein JW796_03470 [Candidatus Dojkabacteria bacterium]|nr:hypothetical protein [Candidatus Dojkabacteria bacterium]